MTYMAIGSIKKDVSVNGRKFTRPWRTSSLPVVVAAHRRFVSFTHRNTIDSQQLRCDRQVPRCARCTRIGSECSYPEPPDRKLIAARRKPPRSRDVLKHSISHKTATIVGADLTAADQRVLIDIYFSYIFKATLIFHPPTFELSYTNGSLPRHVLLAVFALSTK